MALAILRYESSSGGRARMGFDIGKNRYYAYAVGDRETERRNGVPVLRDPHFTSPLMGPLPEQAMGRGVLEIAREHLDRDHRYVQLMSFRGEDRTGPAISDIVPVPATGDALDDLPDLTFGQELQMDRLNQYVETVPMRYREARYSNAMFLGALANLLPSILPAVAPLVGNLLGGGGGSNSGGGNGGAPAPLINAIGNPDTIRQIVALIQQIASAGSGSAGATGTPAAAAAPVQATGYRSLRRYSPALAARMGRPRRPVSSRRGGGSGPRYAEAQVAPALLAALPALMPLLQQVLNPQTIQAVLEAPARHTGVVIDGLKDMARLGIESHEQDLRHLRELNPGVDDPALDALLASLSLGLSQRQRELNYKRVESVRLRFAEVHTEDLYGQTKTLYHYGQALAFPFVVETPRPIASGVLQLSVKDAESLEVLLEKTGRVKGVEGGPAPVVPRLSEAQVRTLQPNKDYLICLTLVWKNRSGANRGSAIKQKITLVSDYAFDRVEESSELIPLNDVARFREFWHKIWHGEFRDDLKRYALDCKYYYVLNAKRTSNARMETKMLTLGEEDRRVTGRLKTGMELSPDELNRLIPRIAPGAQPLSSEELQALRSQDFVERFNQAARYQAKLRGRSGDSGALWVYPEFKLQRVVLQQVGQVNANGNVLNFVEHSVQFPMPALLHFIGARTA